MRIISGLYKGKRLNAPQGLTTRPTAERVKEAIFSAIQFDIDGRHVLDLFCGSGQMGLEALSRGAQSCTFCDGDRRAADCTQSNIDLCGAGKEAKLVRGEAKGLLSRCEKGSFGLIFLDPPYDSQLLNTVLKDICSFDILAQGGIIVCEHKRGDFTAQINAPYRVLKSYNYGAVGVTTIIRE